MSSQHPAPAGPEQEDLGLERLVFFSDAVFAIAITLLVLEIRLPALEGAVSDAALRSALLALWPRFLSFLISFLVVAVFWVGHHRRFRFIRRYDSRLIWLNLLLLMSVAFVPFPTSILGEYGNRTATIFYALTIAWIGLVQLGLWLYASGGNRLTVAALPAAEKRRETLRLLAAPAVFLVSIGIAWFNDDVAKFSWLLLLPISLFVH